MFSFRLRRPLLELALFLPLAAAAQQSAGAPLPVFDVVAIHENKSATMSSYTRWGGDAYVSTNTELTDLIAGAYSIRPDLISGLPGWASSLHFDINAKVSDSDADTLKKLSREQRQAMKVALLKDRFRLRAHIEVKTLPVYDLVLAKGGSKLKENPALPSATFDAGKTPFNLRPGSFMISDSQMTGLAIPLSTLAFNLAFRVERNVIDKTGLTGKYDVNLKWTPAELEGKTESSADSAPDLFTALQEQLGLKLVPSKGPVDTLVIDHVEMPNSN